MSNTTSELFNHALALHQQGELKLAHEIYLQVLSSDSNVCNAMQLIGVSLSQRGNFVQALKWIDLALDISPKNANIWNNRARVLLETGQHTHALESAEKALEISPLHIDALFNAGKICMATKKFELAYEYFSKIIAIQVSHSARKDRVLCLQQIISNQENSGKFSQSTSRSPLRQWYECELLHTATWLCDWSDLSRLNDIPERIYKGDTIFTPFVSQTLFDDPKLLLAAAIHFATTDYGSLAPSLPPHKKTDKVRIGYYSSDFRNHPMAMLIPEVIECHNRDKFEVYLFCLKSVPTDPYRERLRRASDNFIEVENMSDKEISDKSKSLGIDIAIDLMGFTANSRHGIYQERCAPTQLSWLGMPGTSGSQAMDYIIADPIIVPIKDMNYFSEKVVHLPCYFPNDSKREVIELTPSKESMGLPSDSFIFCCFNTVYKILPETFQGWMRILRSTPNSVLWLNGIQDVAIINLRKEAENQGVSANRLIFANRLPSIESHLARQRLADLFLDTFPYNAHTTAADALWVGLPVLTRSGKSFASRVAGSLLTRIGLPELITYNQSDFEARAIYLANQGQSELKSIRIKLNTLRKTSKLFDGKSFAHDLEKAYLSIYERSQASMAPEYISVV